MGIQIVFRIGMYQNCDMEPDTQLADRVKLARKIRGLSQAELAKRVNTGQSTIASIENGRNKGSGYLLYIATALDVEPRWLADGTEPMEKPRRARAEDAQIVVWDKPEDLPPDENRVWVDRWDYSYSAGDGMIQWEVRQKAALPFTMDFFKSIGCNHERCRLVMVRGSSMEPFLFDRDMIMVDTSRTEPKDGAIYAVMFEGEALVKQIFKEPGGALVLHSFNTSYRDKRIEPDVEASFHIVGAVVYRSGGGFLT